MTRLGRRLGDEAESYSSDPAENQDPYSPISQSRVNQHGQYLAKLEVQTLS